MVLSDPPFFAGISAVLGLGTQICHLSLSAPNNGPFLNPKHYDVMKISNVDKSCELYWENSSKRTNGSIFTHVHSLPGPSDQISSLHPQKCKTIFFKLICKSAVCYVSFFASVFFPQDFRVAKPPSELDEAVLVREIAHSESCQPLQLEERAAQVISPESGLALQDVFELKMDGWSSQDTPISYMFSYQAASTTGGGRGKER